MNFASMMYKAAFYGDLKELEELIKTGDNPQKLEKVSAKNSNITDSYFCLYI